MIGRKLRGEMVESLYQNILGQLDGVDDNDTDRPRMLLERWIDEIRNLAEPRLEVVAVLEQAIAAQWTAGEMRRRIRTATGRLAQGTL